MVSIYTFVLFITKGNIYLVMILCIVEMRRHVVQIFLCLARNHDTGKRFTISKI